jgi:glutathione peroxidase
MTYPEDIYAFEARTIDGEPAKLADYKGKTLLIVNTASHCGFTPQYAGLEKLYREYKDSGFAILGFPCNQFGKQEPGTGEEIKNFCETNYNISFPVFEKIEVNGPGTFPLYRYLKKAAPGVLGIRRIHWNFTKFLVSREGKVLHRFAPATTPDALRKHIEKAL